MDIRKIYIFDSMKTICKPIILTLVLAMVAGAAAFGATVNPSNKYRIRKVTSKEFDAVRTNTAIDIVYTVGPTDIEIYAPDNLLPYIQVTLKGTEIIVSYKEDMHINGKHKSEVRISAPAVKRFTTGSAGNITINSNISLKNEELELIVLSAGDIKARNLEAQSVLLRTNSAGDIETGSIKADNVSLIANSAGDIETDNITAKKEAKLICNSAGDIEAGEVYAGSIIKTVTNSAGDIEIPVASAPDISVSANSSGDIEIKNAKATNVSAATNSAGNIKISGICSEASLSSGSTGSILARNLKASNVTASARSVGNIECHALKSLSAVRTGTGKIRYAGNPSETTIQDRKGGVTPL